LARWPVTGYATALESISVGVNRLAGMARALVAVRRTAQYTTEPHGKRAAFGLAAATVLGLAGGRSTAPLQCLVIRGQL